MKYEFKHNEVLTLIKALKYLNPYCPRIPLGAQESCRFRKCPDCLMEWFQSKEVKE